MVINVTDVGAVYFSNERGQAEFSCFSNLSEKIQEEREDFKYKGRGKFMNAIRMGDLT